MSTPESPDPTPRPEDAEAILNRRRFLIQAALTGAGVGAVLAGARAAEPQICLKIAPPKGTNAPPHITNAPPVKPPTNAPPTNPQPCLSPPAPRPRPQVCLSVAPAPRPCLSIKAPEK
jgi:hypothetical protein